MKISSLKSMPSLKDRFTTLIKKFLMNPLKSSSTLLSWILIAGGIISLPWFFTSELKKQKHRFENDYRQDLQAPFRNIQNLEANKNYVFFQIGPQSKSALNSAVHSNDESKSEIIPTFKIESVISSQPVSVDEAYKSVILDQSGRTEHSIARFSVDQSGPYVISAITNNGNLARFTMRSESPLENSVRSYSQLMLVSLFMIALGVLLRFPESLNSIKQNISHLRGTRNRTHSLPRVHPMSKSRV